MKKIIRIALIILLVILVIIQFIRPEKNISGTVSGDIATTYRVPDDVMNSLKRACYDCHSNTSKYPMYWNFQPVAWFLGGHINEGKHHLNFYEFTSYPIRRQYKAFHEIDEQVKEGEMPLSSYTLLHDEARLTDQEKLAIEQWAIFNRNEIKNNYPPDSLRKK